MSENDIARLGNLCVLGLLFKKGGEFTFGHIIEKLIDLCVCMSV